MARSQFSAISQRDFMQADVLDRRPDNREATSLRRKHLNLIGTLPHVAKQTLNGIRTLNVSMHALRELVKRQQVLFIFSQASHRFWIALAVLGFEGRQVGHCLLLCWLAPDSTKFGLHIASLSPGNSVEDIALLMQQTALTRGCRKEFADRSEQTLMPIGHDQIDL